MSPTPTPTLNLLSRLRRMGVAVRHQRVFQREGRGGHHGPYFIAESPDTVS